MVHALVHSASGFTSAPGSLRGDAPLRACAAATAGQDPGTRAPRSRIRPRQRAGPAFLLLALGLALALPGSAEAKVFMTQDTALALVFGSKEDAERRTAYLTEEQAARIRADAGTRPASRVVVYYAGGGDPNAPQFVYFDSHLVRTLPETIMVVVGTGGRVRRVDILSFDEPEDYLPKARWMDQFPGRSLDDDLSTSRGIRAVTGATLSSRAITDAVRRVLATHAALRAPAGGAGAGP